jgi:hypothetical protein
VRAHRDHDRDTGREACYALGPESSFLASHEWVTWVQQDRGTDAKDALVRNDRRLVGAMALYHVHEESHAVYLPQALHGGRWRWRCLIAGTAPGLDERVARRRDLDARMLKPSGTRGSTRPSARRTSRAPTAPCWFLSTAAADMTLPISSPAFEDDAARAPPNEHLPRAQGVPRRRYDVGVQRLSACASEAGPLIAALQRRYGPRGDGAVLADFLRRQAQALGERSLGLTYRRNSALFWVCLRYVWATYCSSGWRASTIYLVPSWSRGRSSRWPRTSRYGR